MSIDTWKINFDDIEDMYSMPQKVNAENSFYLKQVPKFNNNNTSALKEEELPLTEINNQY